jgi:hypothetical protein
MAGDHGDRCSNVSVLLGNGEGTFAAAVNYAANASQEPPAPWRGRSETHRLRS